ncbi:SGNH/GDSL hydrolase family protein [Bacillus sp. ISL-47]|uniref:SGNH/GDSL hydrolase family protein n=1 Tax=Bacillus sp. ISL-47 TaxID=2819130 RepID=UPI001BE90CCE|nr:SGNH/GDSL hydrolase family protein [Bacillus sp. ISL-47]MBT2689210.1 SGNH/GDSL hydrolase family protein [Bacillus sp. ISL-47]MBT2708669.1 SGNH/GDSL hydrolase family protein [Pseudomonas sp. ISL-84]
MKAFFTTILAIGCVVILILGNLHWKEKTAVIKPEAAESKTEVADQETNTASAGILKLAANWPKESQELLKKRIEEKKPLKIHIVGSEALGEGANSWPELLKAELMEAYGESTIDVKISSHDLNSLEYINEDTQQELIAEKADLVILEPFTLKDNGVVTIEDSLLNVDTIISDTKDSNPNLTFILQPPHPLYNATFYPVQVENLKQFAEQNNITYLDHWTAWPDQTSQEMKEYLSSNNSQPSEKGHEVWAEYLVEYFISK